MDQLRFSRVFAVLLLAAAMVSNAAFAEYSEADYDTSVSTRIKGHYQHDAEQIDLFTGQLQMRAVDLVLPGNGGLDLIVQRYYKGPLPPYAAIGDDSGILGDGWQLHFGELNVEVASRLCDGKPTSLHYTTTSGSNQLFYHSNNAPNLWITKDLHALRCSGGRIYIYTPGGLRYRYLQVVNQGAFLVDRIDDQRGNWIAIRYHSRDTSWNKALIDHVSSSDGRSLDFEYDHLGTGLGKDESLPSFLTAIRINGTSTRIRYQRGENNTLTQVTLANGQVWHYDYFPIYTNNKETEHHPYAKRVSASDSPSGRHASYSYSKGGILGDLLTRLDITGVGVWNYSYDKHREAITTQVRSPLNCIKYRHARDVDAVWQWGSLLERHHYASTDCSGSPVQSTSYSWSKVYLSGDNDAITGGSDSDTYLAVPSAVVTTQDGDTYTTRYRDYDVYGQAGTIEGQTNSGPVRTQHASYYSDVNRWQVRGDVQTQRIDGISGEISNSYNAQGLLSQSSRYGVITSYQYTANGDLAEATDGTGLTTRYSDYYRGIPRLEQRPNGSQVQRQLDQLGYLSQLSHQDVDGQNITAVRFDALGRLLSIDLPRDDDAAITLSYRLTAQGPEQTLLRGISKTVRQYNTAGQLLYQDQNGLRVDYRYDALGRLLSKSNPSAPTQLTSYQYDALGRLIQTTDPSGNRQRIAYLSGQRQQHTDAKGQLSTYSYQSYGNPEQRALVSVDAPESQATRIERNLLDAITRVQQNGTSETYHYNSAQQLDWQERPELGRISYSYDAAGRRISEQHGSNPVVNYRYDSAGRLAQIDYTGSADDLSYRYNRRDQITALIKTDHRIDYRYDGNGNLTQETHQQGTLATRSLGYSYDELDHLDSMSYPSGASVSYAPNANGQATQVGDDILAITYTSQGQIDQLHYANGVTTRYSYDANRRPLEIDATGPQGALLHQQYRYDPNGNLSQQQDLVASQSHAYSYDALNRLVRATGPWGDNRYRYDSDGDLLEQQGSDAKTYRYDGQNRLIGIDGSSPKTYQYDNYSQIQSDGSKTYRYGPDHNLQQLTQAGKVINYRYDGHNRRWQTQISGQSPSTQLYNHQGQLVHDQQDSQWREYHLLNGQTIAIHRPHSVEYPHADLLGSANTSSDEGGQLSSEQSYRPYGQIHTSTTQPKHYDRMSCPDGWSLNGSQCIRSQSAINDTQYSCPAGWTLSGSQCNRSQAATPEYRYVCQGSGDISPHPWDPKKCVKYYGREGNVLEFNATPVLDHYTCSAGWTLSGSQCTQTQAASARPQYRCPTGWALSGDQCSQTQAAHNDSFDTCPNGYLVLGSSCQAYTDHAQGYTGHSHDLDTGLIYMQARYYDPSIGRFLAPDPVGFTETNLTSFNRYAYANNNPYKYVDPDGRFGIIGFGIGAAIEITVQYAETGTVNDWGKVGISGVVGAVTGGIAGRLGISALKGTISTTTAMGLTAAAAGTLSTVGSVATDVLNDIEINPEKAALAGVAGAIGGAVGAKIGNASVTALEKLSAMGGIPALVSETTRNAIVNGGKPEISVTFGQKALSVLSDSVIAATQNELERKLDAQHGY